MPGVTLQNIQGRVKSLCWRLEEADIEFDSPLKESEVLAFEHEHCVRLPAHYRLFLLEIGNGGFTHKCGPAREGLLPLNTLPKNYPLSQEAHKIRLSRPFPLRNAIEISSVTSVPDSPLDQSSSDNSSDSVESTSPPDASSPPNISSPSDTSSPPDTSSLSDALSLPDVLSSLEASSPPDDADAPDSPDSTTPCPPQDTDASSTEQEADKPPASPVLNSDDGITEPLEITPTSVHNGTLVLGTHPHLPSTFFELVVAGPCRGEVWLRDEGGMRPVYECEHHKTGRVTFLEVMEAWVTKLEDEDEDEDEEDVMQEGEMDSDGLEILDGDENDEDEDDDDNDSESESDIGLMGNHDNEEEEDEIFWHGVEWEGNRMTLG